MPPVTAVLRATRRAGEVQPSRDALRLLGVLAALMLVACSDGSSGQSTDAGAERDSGAQVDGGGDGGTDGGPALVPCIDRPGELQRAPDGQLPCELVPPGLKR